jgi:hypothetical protein
MLVLQGLVGNRRVSTTPLVPVADTRPAQTLHFLTSTYKNILLEHVAFQGLIKSTATSTS